MTGGLSSPTSRPDEDDFGTIADEIDFANVPMPPVSAVERQPDPSRQGRRVIYTAAFMGIALVAAVLAVDVFKSSSTTSVLAPFPRKKGVVNPMGYDVLGIGEALANGMKRHQNHTSEAWFGLYNTSHIYESRPKHEHGGHSSPVSLPLLIFLNSMSM
jgi:hypothetical protein